MSQGRTYIIGDVHGELNKLHALLDSIPIVSGDRLVLLGDLIDRGPEPRKVVEFVMDLREERSMEVVVLKGNHEDMLLKALRGDDMDVNLFVLNGGRATLRKYTRHGELDFPANHLRFFTSLPLYYEVEHFICVQAGLFPGVPLHDQAEDDLLWIREPFLRTDHDFGKVVIHGHTVTRDRQPEIQLHRIGIDTGACRGGPLTCICMPDRKFYSAA